MEPRFNTTYFNRIENSKNPDVEYNQIHKKLKLLLSCASSAVNNLTYANNEIVLKNEFENIETTKHSIYQLEFTYLVLKIKTTILNRETIVNSLKPEYLEAAHKKAIEILLPSLQSELLFLTAFKFDKESALKTILPEIVKNILMSNYCFLEFTTFKHSISKAKIQESIVENAIFTQKVIENIEEIKRKETTKQTKNENCIIC